MTSTRTKLQLLCFPYAGGSARIFGTWSPVLGSEIQVKAIELPGHGNRWRENLFSQLDPLVRILVKQIAQELNTPFACFGHSMGALLAFEVVRQLRRDYGLLPKYLLISGRESPQTQQQSIWHKRPQNELVEHLRQLGGTPSEVLDNPELVEFFMPIIRADYKMLETYTYTTEPCLECPIAVFGGLEDPEVSSNGLQAWKKETCGEFQLFMMKGNHFFLHTAESELLHCVRQCLLQSDTILV